jgi:SAM-dependent methyltransferase
MDQTWENVWSRRELDPLQGSILSQLMAADGLDTAFCGLTERAWRQFVRRTAATLGISHGASVFEVGCGAGAFLHELDRRGCLVAGLDASAALIRYARQALPGGRFTICDALSFTEPGTFEFVVSCGVFLYFPSLDYAREVVHLMVSHATRGVAILDVPDQSRQEAALSARRSALGEAAYESRYRGLSHLHYRRDWLLGALGEEGVADVWVEDQAIPGYGNGAYRFNVFASLGSAGSVK